MFWVVHVSILKSLFLFVGHKHKEAERMAKRARRRELKQRAASMRGDQVHTRSFSDSSEELDTDEEYFKIIAGEDGEAAEDANMTPAERARLEALREAFKEADINADGTLTFSEVGKMKGLFVDGSEDEGVLEERMSALETQVNDNTAKLDRILALLEKRNN